MITSMNLGEQHFELVVTRGDGVSIYRGDDQYLRIGPAGKLDNEIAIQRRMLDAGFPVPDLIETGEHLGLRYAIESSLGPDTLGDRFDAEMDSTGAVSDHSFETFLRVVETFARAQLTTASNPATVDDLRRIARADDYTRTRIDLASQVEQAFDRIAHRLWDVPAVLTHGDFHAYNICERGVIDLETFDHGPASYDLICAIIMPDLFPPDPRDYRFSPEQRARYLQVIDDVFAVKGLSAPSGYIDEFRLCRAIWLAARRERPPTTLAWLDDQCLRLLNGYLDR